jgi:hypothetical protein
MHEYVLNSRENASANQPTDKQSRYTFCNYIHEMKGWRGQDPCNSRYPHQRYFQLNLIPIFRYGTIEFRAHSATTDVERITRWSQFLLAFVEYFGYGAGRAEMTKYFESSADEDYAKLQDAQRRATMEDLFNDLGELVDEKSARYYMSRQWEETGDKTCNPPQTRGKSYVSAKCAPGDDDFITAVVSKEFANGNQVLHVALPASASADTVTILLPDGATWTVSFWHLFGMRVSAKLPNGRRVPVRNNKDFEFEYNPVEQEELRADAEMSADFRCCCDDEGENCLWFSKEVTNWRGRCPIVCELPGGVKCTKKRFTGPRGATCRNTHHNSRGKGKCMPKEDITPSAFGPDEVCK